MLNFEKSKEYTCGTRKSKVQAASTRIIGKYTKMLYIKIVIKNLNIELSKSYGWTKILS